MFGWFKSKERVTVVRVEPDVTKLTVEDALVKMVWSGSPDSWSPHTIDFIYKDQEYKLSGAWLLKNVCKTWRNRNSTKEEVYFSAVLTIKDKQIIKVDAIIDMWR